jgi:hypothetical protein
LKGHMNYRFFIVSLLMLVSGSYVYAVEKSVLTPVETVKLFAIALEDRNETAIMALALPNPKMSVLWTDTLSEEDKVILDRIEKDRLRVLKAGEIIPMEGGNAAVPAEFATETRVLVYGKTMPYPFVAQRVDGIWKVNVGPLLYAREKEMKQKAAGNQ